MKKKYQISLIGCDDDTIIEKKLTENELKLIQSIAEQIQTASTYRCQPTMNIKELKK